MRTPLPSPTLLTLAVAVLAAATLLAGCGDSRATAASAPTAPRTTAVGVVVLQPETVALTTELPGRTRAPLVAEIRPQVGGLVQARRFTEGERVAAGQVLYQLDAASYEATVASASAAVARAEATLQASRQTAERRAELLKIDAVSRQDAQDAQTAQQQAEADLAAAKATLATARIALARTRIVSPIAGRVDVSSVSAGALVTADQTTALTTVRQTDPLWVDIPQSSADWLRLQRELTTGRLDGASRDAAVTLVLEDGRAYERAGQLRLGAVSVNASTGAVTLRAEVPNPQGLLLPGMAVRAVLPTAQAKDALLVPQQAVSRDAAGQARVWVVGADDKVSQRPIRADRAVGARWLVSEGLAAGDRVVVEGGQKIKPGDTVQAQVVSTTPTPTPATASAAPRAAGA